MNTEVATPAAPVAAKRRFLRPRFTLATLLLLITILSPPFGYIAYRRAWNTRRVAAYELLTDKGIILPPRSDAPGAGNSGWWQKLLLDDIASSPVPMVIFPPGFRIDENQIPKDEDLVLLRFFPEIERVEIQFAEELTDRGLATIVALPELRALRVEKAPKVSGAFLRELPPESKLSRLDLNDLDNLEGAELANLQKLPWLDTLWISQCKKLDDEALRAVELPKAVKELTVYRCPLGDETLIRWLDGHQLRNLSLSVPISRKSTAALASQRELTYLNITNAPLLDEDFRFLANCPNLSILKLSSMPIHGELLSWIVAQGKLQNLELDSTLVEDSRLTHLSRFNKLSFVGLNWTPLTGAGFASLKTLPQNCTLSLVGTEFNDDGKRALAALRSAGPSNLVEVSLPANWTVEDFEHFPGKIPPWPIKINPFTARRAWHTTGRTYEIQSARSALLTTEPLDHCPADLMKPIIDLRDQAENRKEAEMSEESTFLTDLARYRLQQKQQTENKQ